ncbi:MAG: Hpt domain-containing protein, partial [Flavobacteriales bacterium]|nr:Hpt domain-containing protein [Flavobacteriales bacterium]
VCCSNKSLLHIIDIVNIANYSCYWMDEIFQVSAYEHISKELRPLVFSKFSEELSKAIDTLNGFSGNEDQLKAFMHRLNGSSKTFGAIALGDMAASLEEKICNNQKINDKDIKSIVWLMEKTILYIEDNFQ